MAQEPEHGIESLLDHYSANRADIYEPNEKDRTVERIARSICDDHGVDFDSLNTECRVMDSIAVGFGSLFHDPLGRLSTHKQNSEEHILLVRSDMFQDEDLLYGVVAHELAHAVQHHEWGGMEEDDPAFVFLCKLFGGFHGCDEVQEHAERFGITV